MRTQIATKLRDCDMVLIGLGEDIDMLKHIRKSEEYSKLIESLPQEWLVPYIEKHMILQRQKHFGSMYKKLADCLKQKNYFIISVCQDGLAERNGLDCDRIVKPCGGYEKLQCSGSCTSDLYCIPRELDEKVKAFIEENVIVGEFVQPICPKCGKPLVFNNIFADKYIEEGYLPQWQKYTKWLQGTLNKNLCILELGVGLRYPSVIRWPFEKIVFFNQKSEFYRVHTSLYQIAEETKDRAFGICQAPEDFLNDLFNEV